ncbi:MAG TPA: helicase HerA-like domain-containing protein [Gaiellaceae bacterium]|nr:helicase HerA-like domain-containing protein [Gaiellaceae bacterium]
MTAFGETIAKAYAVEGAAVDLGLGVHEGSVERDAVVRLPLATMNRHGLIAGATGTGKTRTLQLIAEQLSDAGVSVFAADYKGDLSGLHAPGAPDGPAPKRMADLGLPYEPTTYPVEFLSLGGIGPGVPVRATVTDFGPELLGKVLRANETQQQSLALVFRYADEHGLALVDLADLRAMLSFLESPQGKDELEGIGGVSKQTIGVLLRALVGLEDGGGNDFFGEPLFEIGDLLRTAPDGRGMITALELASLQDRPELFSTALMWLLAELFEQLPEVGDLDKPKLVFFFDEAHLLFADATASFVESVVRTVRMIRSKGVGVFFVTQQPTDLPADVLGQLGARVQHALRAFTPDDADALKKTVRTYPKSDFYDLEKLLTELGTGEAAVTILSEHGIPTPVVHTRLQAPRSSMTTTTGIDEIAKASPLWAKYGTRLEKESAAEELAKRVEQSPEPAARSRDGASRETKTSRGARKDPSDPLTEFLNSRQGKALQREVVRGAFSLLRKRL